MLVVKLRRGSEYSVSEPTHKNMKKITNEILNVAHVLNANVKKKYDFVRRKRKVHGVGHRRVQARLLLH